MSTLREKGYPYAFDSTKCEECGGACCIGEKGNIFVNRGEIEAIANHLELDIEHFKREYLRKEGYKLSLKELLIKGSYECIFFDAKTKGCAIYQVRPKQCRTFPFWEYYKQRVSELKRECIGVIDV